MNRIRECRKNKKLTLKQLSEELAKNNFKISADALGKYERGNREPKLGTWIKLADFFNVPVSYLQGVSDIADKDAYSSFGKWLKTVNSNKTQGDVFFKDEGDVFFKDEGDVFLKEQALKRFSILFNAIINNERMGTDKYTRILYRLLKDNISDVASLEDINYTTVDVFKIGLEAKNGNKKAKKVYDEIDNLITQYLGIAKYNDDFKL